MSHQSETLSTLEKGLTVLTAFSAQKPDWAISELAQHLSMHKSTVHKVLATYQRWGLVQQDPASRRYRLGLRLVDLARGVSPVRGLREAARPELEQLVALSGETAKLCVADGFDSFVIEAVEGPDQLRMTSQAGRRSPLYAGASNKVLLAYMPPQSAEQAILHTAPPEHPSRSDPARFRAELQAIAQAGHAVSHSEVEAGVTSISAPVHGAAGQVVASISVVGPTARLTSQRIEALVEPVKKAAAVISRRLGFHS